LKENVIVGRLIPAGTGFAHHADRRRTREQDLADQLKLLEETQLAEAEALVSPDAVDDAAEPELVVEAGSAGDAEPVAEVEAAAEKVAPEAEVVAADEADAAPEGGEETTAA
jgi:hypothetical protein